MKAQVVRNKGLGKIWRPCLDLETTIILHDVFAIVQHISIPPQAFFFLLRKS